MASFISSSPKDTDNHKELWKVAKDGIDLLINNKGKEAETMFLEQIESLPMYAGYSIVVFMDALMTFEEDKLTLAMSTLKEAEKRCIIDKGWFKSVRSKVFGSELSESLSEYLESQIVLADSMVFLATLTFLQHDLSGYFKGGWILRKSWKLYQHTYTEISRLYRDLVGDPNLPDIRPSIHREESLLNCQVPESTLLEEAHEVNGEEKHEEENGAILGTDNSEEKNGFKNEKETKEGGKQIGEKSSGKIAGQKSSGKLAGEKSSGKHGSEKKKEKQAPSNGYRPNSSFFPTSFTPKKQSISCYENLSSYTAGHECCSDKCLDGLSMENGFISGRTLDVYAHSINTSNGYNFSSNLSSPTSETSPMINTKHSSSNMKKSSSANSALSRHSGRMKGLATHLSTFNSNISLSYFTSTFHLFSSSERLKAQEIDKVTITRLMGAVCFGYGLFQLGVSLLPPALLKITNILGFSGNRQIGIENLMFARLGSDMRAPLATLALLWYHTIVRPFYALDGSNVQAGVEAATQLINESLKDYGESALFLFFKGRVDRLKSDIPSALESFQKSVDNATQREMKILSKHELGWCHLIQLDFVQAETTFHYMKTCSRWSRTFYAYLATISAGTYNNFKDSSSIRHMRELLENGPKGTQLDEFLLRRFRICPSDDKALMNTSAIFWRLLVYELLYLWNTLPSCTPHNIGKINVECEFSKEEEVMIGLGKLLSGVCYCIQKNYERGMHNFRYCLELRKSIANNAPDAHVSAFAQYELGLLLIKDEKTKQEGKNLLHQVSQYKDYDFEQRLSVRIHMILKHL